VRNKIALTSNLKIEASRNQTLMIQKFDAKGVLKCQFDERQIDILRAGCGVRLLPVAIK